MGNAPGDSIMEQLLRDKTYQPGPCIPSNTPLYGEHYQHKEINTRNYSNPDLSVRPRHVGHPRQKSQDLHLTNTRELGLHGRSASYSTFVRNLYGSNYFFMN